jgi:hypothetical protein
MMKFSIAKAVELEQTEVKTFVVLCPHLEGELSRFPIKNDVTKKQEEWLG